MLAFVCVSCTWLAPPVSGDLRIRTVCSGWVSPLVQSGSFWFLGSWAQASRCPCLHFPMSHVARAPLVRRSSVLAVCPSSSRAQARVC